MSSSPAVSLDSPASAAADSSEWSSMTPANGTVQYVIALQKLGLHMASAVPQAIRDAAITALGVPPQRDLLVGDFHSRTNERMLFLSRLEFAHLVHPKSLSPQPN